MAAKERVIGIEIGNHARAYPLRWLSTRPGVLNDTVGSQSITIEISAAGEVIEVRDAQGKPIPATYAYWFAWQAFHPKTEIFQK